MSAKSKKSRPRAAKTKVLDPRAILLEVGVLLAGLGVSIATIPPALSPFGPVKAFVLSVGVCLIAIALVLSPRAVVRTVGRLSRIRASLAWPLFLLVGVLATITSLDPWQSLTGHYAEYQGLLLVLASAVVGFGAATLAQDPEAWVRLRRAAALVVLGVGALAAYQLLRMAGAVDLARATSSLGNASNLGVFLCLMIPVVLSGARSDRSRGWSVLCWAAIAAGVVLLALTLSRGAWLGGVAGALTWLLIEGRSWPAKTRWRWVAIVSAGLIVAAGVAWVAVPQAAPRLVEAVRDPSKGTLGWRLEVWRITAGMIASRPFLGFGPATFRYAFPSVRTAVTIVGQTNTQIVDDPHNLTMSVAVQYGVAGLVLLYWLICGAVLSLWRRAKTGDSVDHSSAALGASIVAAVVALQAHFLTLDTWPMFALILGWALGLASVSLAADAAEPTAKAASDGGAAEWWARGAFGAVALAFAFVAVCAVGLLLSDGPTLQGIRLAQAKRPWTEVRVPLQRAASLAWWEPTARLTIARAATQSLNTRFDSVAVHDGEQVFAELAHRTPADPLVPAQAAEFYVVAGIRSGDVGLTRRGLELANAAQRLDSQNGFRWETVGSAFFALQELQPARQAYERAVKLNPRDAQAWTNLASVYEKLGRASDAAKARTWAAKAAKLPVVRFQ